MPPIKNSSIFTRKRMGLDNSVWLVMLAFIVLSSGLFGYTRLTREKKKPCIPIDIYVKGTKNIEKISFNLGEELRFRVSPITIKDKVVWDFGDDSRKADGSTLGHTFTKEARFTVRAIVNDECQYETRITIRKPMTGPVDTLGNLTEDIIGFDQAFVNETVKFSTPHDAKIFEWYIENNKNYPIRKGKEASYNFRTQSKFVIVLVLDNDRKKKYTKTIIVSKRIDASKPEQIIKPEDFTLPPITRPEDKTEPEKDKPDISLGKLPTKVKIADETFKTYLQALVCNKMNAADFDRYLCSGQATTVIINGKERKTFAELCADIKGKKIKIEGVRAGRDKENCAISVAVSYDKKRFLGKDPCKD